MPFLSSRHSSPLLSVAIRLRRPPSPFAGHSLSPPPSPSPSPAIPPSSCSPSLLPRQNTPFSSVFAGFPSSLPRPCSPAVPLCGSTPVSVAGRCVPSQSSLTFSRVCAAWIERANNTTTAVELKRCSYCWFLSVSSTLLAGVYLLQVMETDKTNIHQNQGEEEYVLLDLDAVCGQVDIPPDEPYVLSGLDTLNPMLTIGNRLKLIGEYEETVGTCLIFSENEKPSSVCEGSESLEANLTKGTLETDHNQNPSKPIMPVTSLHKILKFRLLPEADEQDLTGKPPDASSQKEHF